MNQFKALRFHRLGMPAEVLQLEDVLSTEPGEGEVRIQVHAFALNRADWLYANGWHYSQPELPARIGSECAGIVVATGHGVDPGLLGKSVCTVPFDNWSTVDRPLPRQARMQYPYTVPGPNNGMVLFPGFRSK